MGYRVEYTYYNKIDKDNYDKEKPKTIVKSIGGELEDVSREYLVAFLMKEYSNNDIWIDDVKIIEIQKLEKPLSFKEGTNGCMVIGGKKYHLNLNQMMKLLAKDMTPVNQNKPQLAQPTQSTNVNKFQDKPIRIEFYSPDEESFFSHNPSFHMTLNKQYPIFSEKIGGKYGEVVYSVRNDLGDIIELESHYFKMVNMLDSDKKINALQQQDPSFGASSKIDPRTGMAHQNNISKMPQENFNLDDMSAKLDQVIQNRRGV